MRRTLPTLLIVGTLAVVGLVLTPVLAADEPVPLETCAQCHDEVAAAFVAGPHGRAMAKVSPELLQRACETCHGPAAKHVDDPSPENINRHPSSEACASCHADRAGGMELTTPGHPRNDVQCLDCHASGHKDPGTEHMLRLRPRKLCGGCHQQQAAAFQLPYAHRESAHKPFACTTCHDVHGEGERGRLELLGNGGLCISCHTGKAGPFVFPHPPREVDGCVTCHDPHGSVNPRQLKRHNVADLCLECHADVSANHNLSQARVRACQNCHAAIHGSNRDPRLLSE
jgi:DmsE family decaheme c-type cytochrome